MASFYDTLRELDTLGRRRRGAALPLSDEARFQQLSSFFGQVAGEELPPETTALVPVPNDEGSGLVTAEETAPATGSTREPAASPVAKASTGGDETPGSIEISLEEPSPAGDGEPADVASAPAEAEGFAPSPGPEGSPEPPPQFESALGEMDAIAPSVDVPLNLAEAEPFTESAAGELAAAAAGPSGEAEALRPPEGPATDEPAAAPGEPTLLGVGTDDGREPAATASAPFLEASLEPVEPRSPTPERTAATYPLPPESRSTPAEGACPDDIEVMISDEDAPAPDASPGGGRSDVRLESAPAPDDGDLDIDVTYGLTPEPAAWLAPPGQVRREEELPGAVEFSDEPELPSLDVLTAPPASGRGVGAQPEGPAAADADALAAPEPEADVPQLLSAGAEAPPDSATALPAGESANDAVALAPEVELVPAADDDGQGPLAEVALDFEPAGEPAPAAAGGSAGEPAFTSTAASVPLLDGVPEISAEDAGLLDLIAQPSPPGVAADGPGPTRAAPEAGFFAPAPAPGSESGPGLPGPFGTYSERPPPSPDRSTGSRSAAESPTIRLDADDLSRMFPEVAKAYPPRPPEPPPLHDSGGAEQPGPAGPALAEGQATMIRPALSLVRAQRDHAPAPPEVDDAELLAFARGETPPPATATAWADPKIWPQPSPSEPPPPDPAWTTQAAEWPAPPVPESWSAPAPPAPWETGAAGWSAPAPAAAPTPSWSAPAGQEWIPSPKAPSWTAPAGDWSAPAPAAEASEGPPSWMTPIAETLIGPPPAEDPVPAGDTAERPELASAADYLAEAASANGWSGEQISAWNPNASQPTAPPSMPARLPSSPPASRAPSTPPTLARAPTHPLSSAARPSSSLPSHPPSAPPAPGPWAAAGWEEQSRSLVLSGEHRVVVHTLEGGVKRGIARDIDLSGETIGLAQGPGLPPLDFVPFARIKAVFFMLAPGEKPMPATGRRVKVTFADGRQVEGILGEEIAQGFFLLPIEPRTSTARVYVLSHAVRQVT